MLIMTRMAITNRWTDVSTAVAAMISGNTYDEFDENDGPARSCDGNVEGGPSGTSTSSGVAPAGLPAPGASSTSSSPGPRSADAPEPGAEPDHGEGPAHKEANVKATDKDIKSQARLVGKYWPTRSASKPLS